MPRITSHISNAPVDTLAISAIEQTEFSIYSPSSAVEDGLNRITAAALAVIDANINAIRAPRDQPYGSSSVGSSSPFTQPIDSSPTSAVSSRAEPASTNSVRVTHRWEGSVLCIYDDFFEAKLTSLTDESPEVTAEFSIEDLSEDDRSLLTPGASFYVTAIQERQSGGRIRHSSDVRFRRLGRWREEEIALIRERAKKRRAALGFEDNTR